MRVSETHPRQTHTRARKRTQEHEHFLLLSWFARVPRARESPRHYRPPASAPHARAKPAGGGGGGDGVGLREGAWNGVYPIIWPRICSHEKNPEVSHSSPPSRFSQASGSPPLLSYGGSCPHRAAYLHRRTQRRTAPVFLSVSRQRVCVRGGHVCGAPRPGAARRPREHCSAQLPACAERRPQGGGWPALICWLVHWVWRCKLH